jgi:cell wall-associated NlpC family hydrolase
MRTPHYPDPRPAAPAHWLRLLAALLLALLAACSGPERRSAAPPPPPGLANDVLMRAIGLVGTPYRYGGNTPEGGFDCSGLIGFVFHDAVGLALPRTTRQLADMDRPSVSRQQLKPGDLVFFGHRNRVNHAGIYVGEGRFVHAPSTGGTVRLDALEGHYWRDTYLQARRVLR